MKKWLFEIPLLITSLIFSGCATVYTPNPRAICESSGGKWLWSQGANQMYCTTNQYPITYAANPRGASIICNGMDYGIAPKTLFYDFNITKDSALGRTSQCFARWVSGAQQGYSQEWDLKKFPNGVMQTVQRPNVAGESIDLEYSQKLDKEDYIARGDYVTAYNKGLLTKEELDVFEKQKYIANKDYINAYNKGLLTKDEVQLYLLKDQTEAQQEQARVQQEYQRRQAEAAERAAEAADDSARAARQKNVNDLINNQTNNHWQELQNMNNNSYMRYY